jgi:hypothetical protein
MSLGLSDPRGSEMWGRIERLLVPMVEREFPWLSDPHFVDPIGFFPWGRDFQGVQESGIDYILPSVLVVPSEGAEYRHDIPGSGNSWMPSMFRPYWTGLGVIVAHDAKWDSSQWRLATIMEGFCAIAQLRVFLEGNLPFVVSEIQNANSRLAEIGLYGENHKKPYLFFPAQERLPRLLFRVVPEQVIPH